MPVRHHFGVYVFMAACLSATLSMPLVCGAAEWTVEPSALFGLIYNDNINLTTQPHDSVNGNVITPRLDLGMHTQAWQVTGSAEASRIRYSGDSGLDRNDNAFSLSSAYHSERNTWQLDANSTRDTPLAGQQTSADTGAVQTQTIRESHGFSPSWTRMLTENIKLQLMYQLNDTSYVNGQSVGLYDYRYSTASTTLSNQLSENSQVFVTGSYSSFHVPATGNDSTTRSFQVGITQNFSESMKGTLQAGARRTETLIQGGQPVYTRFSTPFGVVLIQTGVTSDARSQVTSSVFSGSLEKKYELTRMSASLSRSLVPSGSGSVVLQDSFDFGLNREITSRLSAFINLNSLKISNDQSNISNNNNVYYHAETGVNWAWSQEWSLNMSYGYSRVKRESEDKAATGNAVYLTLIYRPLKTSISR
ncbi:surface lipoprotein assembly modifier [Sulfuricaulis sp.]|jgi:hypothetical protein|uniref:surface lipoprotein assembly modifier n=1 Tax=Sulfuricaulis sp. TaxID=2003553 RepID=UPI00355A9578